jgi:hypothetical protein
MLTQNKLECLFLASIFSSGPYLMAKEELTPMWHLTVIIPLAPNISLGWKYLKGTNALAYQTTATMTEKKGFITSTTDGQGQGRFCRHRLQIFVRYKSFVLRLSFFLSLILSVNNCILLYC